MKKTFKFLLTSTIAIILCFVLAIAASAEVDAASVYEWKDGVAYDSFGKIITNELAYDTYGTHKYTMLDKNGKATTWTDDPLGDFYDVHPSDKKGWVQATATVPDGLKQTVDVVLIDELSNKQHIYLYADNKYFNRISVPCGQYYIMSISVNGDNIGKYGCKSNINGFYVTEDAAARDIKIDIANNIDYSKTTDKQTDTTTTVKGQTNGTTATQSQNTTVTGNANTTTNTNTTANTTTNTTTINQQEQLTDTNGGKTVVIILSIVVTILLGGIIFFIYLIKKK